MLAKVFIAGSALAMLVMPAAAQAQYRDQHDSNYYRDRSHYYYDGHHYRDRSDNAVIDTLIGGLLGYGLGVATSGGYNNGYAAPAYGYGYAQPSYGYGYSQPSYDYGYGQPSYGYGYGQPSYGYAQPAYGYGYTQPSYGYTQIMVVPGYTYREGYYWDNYGRRYDRDWMYRRYARR
jgi:hypothetical protein